MEQQNKKTHMATSLKVIRGIRFTNREIDVLACLLSGRAYKKIASLLSISPKTVELHVRNIMLRLKCHSREGIIDFIEKSGEFTLIKIHYSNILVKIAFEQELKKLISITKETNTNCLIFYYGVQKTKASFVYQLEEYLNIAGIKTVSRVWEKGKSGSFLTNKIGINQVNCIIYIISNEFIEQLTLLEYEIEKEASNLIPIIKENPNPIIFLLLNDKKFLEINKKLPSFSYINLVEQGNYYLLVFELLKKLLPDNNIDTNIEGFKKQYEIFNSSVLQKWQKDDGLTTEVVNVKNSNRTEKKSFLKWLIFFIIVICFSFFIFKEINFLTPKSRNLEAKFVNNNQQNALLENRQKNIVFNLPPRNNKFTGRKDALAQIKKHLDKQKIGVITQAISGLGGVGKTQLATEFAYQAIERNDYEAVLWINAETTNATNNVYKELAEFLQIDIRGMDPDKIQAFVHLELTEKYKCYKILFILDNVPNYNDTQNYITKLRKQLSADCTLHILITSRSQDWPEEDPLILDTFTPEEAVMFVRKHLPNEKEDSIVKLTKTLYYFPLALNQATAYIKMHTNIDDYLDLYSTKQKYYLDRFPNNKNQYTESLWKTWNIAFTKLSAPAKEMLFISSYLYPDNIPFAFFDSLAVEERMNAIEDLRKHSFIIVTNDNKSFKIHRLLQEVIRTTIAYDSKNNIVKGKFYELTKAMKLLKNKFDFSYARDEKWNVCGQYLTHAQSLAERAISVGDEFFHTGIQLYSQVAMYLTYVQQDNKNAKEIWEKILTLIKQHYDNDKSFELALASINTHLGHIMRQIGDLNQTEKYVEKAILTYNSKIPTISTNIEKLLPYLRWDKNLTSYDGIKCDQGFAFLIRGHIKRDLADFKAAKGFYEKALELLGECKQVNSTMLYKVAFLQSLADADMYYGDLEAAKNMVNSAKIIVDQNFPNHLEQAYVYERIALIQYYTGMHKEAKENIEKSLKIRLSILSKDHYRIGYTKSTLGSILYSSNQISESIANLKQAEIIHNKNFEEEHYRFISLYINMSYAFEMNKEYDKALQYLAKAQKIAAKGQKSYVLYLYQLPLTEKLPVFLKTKNIHYYIHALELTKKLFGSDHIRVARYHYLLGQVFENIHDNDKARQHYQKALNITTKQQFNDKTLATENQKNIKIIQKHLQSCDK